jgi:hypothetical protein
LHKAHLQSRILLDLQTENEVYKGQLIFVGLPETTHAVDAKEFYFFSRLATNPLLSTTNLEEA